MRDANAHLTDEDRARLLDLQLDYELGQPPEAEWEPLDPESIRRYDAVFGEKSRSRAEQIAMAELEGKPEPVRDPKRWVREATAGRPVEVGIYTVSSPRGEHRTFMVRQDPDFAEGQTVLGMLTGPLNTDPYNYPGVGFLGPSGKLRTWTRQRGTATEVCAATLLHLLNEDSPKGRALREAGYTVLRPVPCRRCGRLLSTAESIAKGIGPECLQKEGFR